MRIAVRTDGPPREWHRRLGERLAHQGHALVVERVSVRRPLPPGLRLLLATERRLYGTRSQLFAVGAVPSKCGAEACDLVLEPRFDGTAGEGALIAALFARRAPRVEVFDVSGEAQRLAGGLPAVERPDVLASALDMVLSRTIQLVEQAVRTAGSRAAPTLSELVDGARVASPAVFFARTLAGKLARRLVDSDGGRDGWRIAMRPHERRDIAPAQAWSADGFALLPNDEQSFQADPFPFTHDGRTCIFYEEFPHATRKGVIAMVELDRAGNASPPRRVLEHDVHLSYPFVFAHEGGVYMMPEMSAAGRIQLFRADPFPDRWIPDRILVDGIVAADASLVAHGGRWWLFGTLSGDGGSSWDALGLFHAPDPFGPWTPHAGNPVLVDAGAARPAGAMWHEAGTLMRVAQDCRGCYGAGLAICRVDRLDSDGYAQTVVERLGPPGNATRIHTLNRADGVEVIDLDGPPRRRRDQATP